MAIIKLKILDQTGRTLATSPAGENISLVHTGRYQPGDWVALEGDGPALFCEIQLEDSMPPVLVYLPDGNLQFPIPPEDNRCNYSPKGFTGAVHLLHARVATGTELSQRRNLALNPYDSHTAKGFYPHAQANVETRNEAVFAARNAIDGVFANWSHGEWPYQSWGINRDPKAELRLDFGRSVLADEIRLTLRADFPHDSWWEEVTVEFSDGSREMFHLKKTGAPQSFSMKPRKIEWLVLMELKKAPDQSPFPALTQIEVWGTNINSSEE